MNGGQAEAFNFNRHSSASPRSAARRRIDRRLFGDHPKSGS
jgi:hypothetical protein